MANPNDPNDPNDGFGEPFGGEPDPFAPEGQQEEESLETGVPEVAATPKRAMLVLILLIASVAFILYLIFGGGDDEVVNQQNQTPVSSAPDAALAVPQDIPQPPQPLPLPNNSGVAPEPPPILPEPASVPVPEPTDEARVARLKSAMLITNTEKRGGDAGAKSRAQAALAGSDPNNAYAQNAYAASEAERAEAKRVKGDLNASILQGKIIDAVLETAINTDLPGTLRAIVSRDVFPESGRVALIPKGSRLIGSYNTGILRGQQRVFIIWSRVIRPDGIDVAINSPGIDNLGRSGVEGHVDNKYLEILSGAALTSFITIGAAIGADRALGEDNQVTTTTNTDGSVTQSGSAGAIATADSVTNAGTIAKGVIAGMLDARPTITIDQGTKVNVFVNRDVVFPEDVMHRARMVP